MAPHSSALAWNILWTEEPGGLQSMGSLRVRHDFTFTFHFHALEKEMATHSNVLAWRIPGMGEPGGLPSMGSHRVGHDWSDLAAAAAADSVVKTRDITLLTKVCIFKAMVFPVVIYRCEEGWALKNWCFQTFSLLLYLLMLSSDLWYYYCKKIMTERANDSFLAIKYF